jgi:hypothetical protein
LGTSFGRHHGKVGIGTGRAQGGGSGGEQVRGGGGRGDEKIGPRHVMKFHGRLEDERERMWPDMGRRQVCPLGTRVLNMFSEF